MAVGAQALKIFEAGLMPGRHISDLGCIVVYFDTGISQLAIDLGGLKLATLAEELAMILTELGFLGVSQAGGALPAEMGCQLGITLCPEADPQEGYALLEQPPSPQAGRLESQRP